MEYFKGFVAGAAVVSLAFVYAGLKGVSHQIADVGVDAAKALVGIDRLDEPN